ncbi:MAG: glycoside hydrolase [Zunongwangia sp.]|uniref:Glycoside hydrolase, catalytic core n=1 Tax=Zunongwangia profunda (strain DSM 18752 / CCTCC AB 206139 / SM-A87) TaxID=655815 RepID=D5BJU6_ZUNPS|nr:DUF5060 domain-containing protein [Zunongwangia profunda]ADF53794.1 glycoside hydrolase, catalytic core [Zunongwangia profunda SM-A87]MAB91624.1 glycoside hydrolase [Planctomycetota bacterium]MAO34840.1 glycoside hydrolase [Zunongwangia sp.]
MKLKTAQPMLYERTDFNISLNEQWENPYLAEDIAVDIKMQSPSGKEILLPCFYVSGESGEASEWEARFAPQEIGRYTYHLVVSKKGEEMVFDENEFTVENSENKGFLHAENNWILRYDNGDPFRGIGENIGWESRTNDDSKFFHELHEKKKYNYNYLLGELSRNGGNFFRTWICSWNLPLDWKDNFNNSRYTASDAYYNPSAVAKLDSLVDLSKKLDLHMMLTLGPGNYSKEDGGFAESTADFFVNPKSRQRYKNRLRYIIARWGYSTSIAAWELFNEIDNVQYRNRDNPIDAKTIVDWHEEMSNYIDKIDPYNHIITTSISHRDLEGLNSLPAIDINQKHIYNRTKDIPGEIIDYEKRFGKPYVIGEFSYEWDWSKNFDEFPEEMDSDFKRGLWYGMFTSTPILPLSWWWEYFDERGMTSYFRGVSKINDMMLKAGNGKFEKVSFKTGNQLESFGVKCGNKIFIYLYNPLDKALNYHVEVPELRDASYEVQSFHPLNLEFSQEKTREGIEVAAGKSLDAGKEILLIIDFD